MSQFDKKAKSWDKSSRRYKVAQSFANFVKKNVSINNDMNILDYGCGTGLVAYEFDEMVKTITGMDSSTKMIEEFLAKSDKDTIKAIKHDINKDNLEINSFDLIVSSMTLHHIEDINTFFEKNK
jgi:predicted TPR repeat methyltransferase